MTEGEVNEINENLDNLNVENTPAKRWGDYTDDTPDPSPHPDKPTHAFKSDVKVVEANLSEKMNDPNHVLYSAVDSFEDFNIKPDILKGILVQFKKPSRIQALTLPILLNSDTNLIAQSQSGTGKTLCFAICMLAAVNEEDPNPQALVLLPSLELAVQVASVIENLARFTQIKVFSILAGERLSRNDIKGQILVGTPGKVKELILRRTIDPKLIKLFVLDEADQMLDEGGIRDSTLAIREKLNEDTRVLLFSATFKDPDDSNDTEGEEKDKHVLEFASQVVPPPVKTILLKRDKLTLDEMKQFSVYCQDDSMKTRLIMEIFDTLEVGQSMIFVNKKDTAKELAEVLMEQNFTVAVIRGDLAPGERKQAMEEFRKGNSRVMVSTNAAARGIDIASVTHVINYDMPMRVFETKEYDYATYLHRIGRTARFGKPGYAINLYSHPGDKRMIEAFRDFYKTTITEVSADQIEQSIQ
ncbi:ATP-dependent RNA helicase [Acrasis kona]|uniref:RNA helicase n=1 Tax=Acrasis kona TaxID=1008807 RepID=A0AAW2ZHN1_9EUKA